MELEMSRFKQFLIEAVGGATFGGLIKSTEMTKIGRRLAMYSIDFNASSFKKMPAKSFRFSHSRMMFTKYVNEDSKSSTQRVMTIVAIDPESKQTIVLLASSKSDFAVVYANQGDLGEFTERTFKSMRTRGANFYSISHRKTPAVVDAGLQIENLFNKEDVVVYVAMNEFADNETVGKKHSDRSVAKSHEDRLLKLNRKIKRRVNIINSVAFKKLSAVAKEAGYRVDNLVKERFQYDNGHEYVYLNVSISRASNEDFLPSIYIDRDKKNKENNKLVATIQTTSWGSMSVEDVEKVIQGYQKALKVAKAINSIKVEEMADFLANDEM